MNLFILDADILIRAKRTYYQFDRVPQFWDWLVHQIKAKKVKMPVETWTRIVHNSSRQRDDLGQWAFEHRKGLLVADKSYHGKFAQVIQQYRWPPPREWTPGELERLGDDPYLIACALHLGATVVSNEVSKPNKQGTNRKVPDVCASLGVECIDLDGTKGVPGLIDRLNFQAK